MQTTQRNDKPTDIAIWRAAAVTLGSLALCLFVGGCGETKAPPAQPAADVGPAAEQPAPGLPGVGLPGAGIPGVGGAAPVMVREKAQVGSGAKGHDYKPGFITTPVSTLFKVEEKIAYDVKVVSAMNLYKGQYGTAPKTHEEFMDRIIGENMIILPELPEGHSYVYDPETETLMVERPE